MLGQPLTMLMPEYLRHLHSAGINRYIGTGRKHIEWAAVQLPGLHKSGGEIPLEISFGEFIKGDQRFFTGVVRDVTERKRAISAARARSTAPLGRLNNGYAGLTCWLSVLVCFILSHWTARSIKRH